MTCVSLNAQQSSANELTNSDVSHKSAAKNCPPTKPARSSVQCTPTCVYPGTPEEIVQCVPAAYNAPSGVDLAGRGDSYAEGSFIYWQPIEEGLELGFPFPNGVGAASLPRLTGNNTVQMNFDWKPGFKIELGTDAGKDNWSAAARYTWFHFTQSKDFVTPNLPVGRFSPYWFNNEISGAGVQIGPFLVDADWKLKLDMIDVELSRAGFMGKSFTFAPFWGLRGLRLDQQYTMLLLSTVTLPPQAFSKYNIDSWAVGARTGFNSSWQIGGGFELLANTALNALYSNYKLRRFETQAANPTQTIVYRENNRPAIRPIMEILLGVNWGTYLMKNRIHMNLSANYEFNIWWNQNMFHALNGGNIGAVDTPDCDLFFHGLTVSTRFDF